MSFPFMNTIRTQLNTTSQVARQPLVLNEGQMIHGKIQQLFPGQLAEVQVGNQKMIAKLEVPMRAGDAYYFQVSSVQPEIQLKIISGPTSSQVSSDQQLHNLMQAMQLPRSPEMTTLLSFVLDNKIPISREGINQAVQLLQTTPADNQQNALAAIQRMLDLKLPLTNQLFQAVLGVESKEGLHATIQALQNTLQHDSSIPVQMRNEILQSLDRIEHPLASATSHALLGEAVKTLFSHEQAPTVRFSAVQLLKGVGILPRQASLPNLQSTVAAVVAERIGISQGTQSLPNNLSPTQLYTVTQFVNELPNLTAAQREGLIGTARTQGFQPFTQALVQVLSERVLSTAVQVPDGQSTVPASSTISQSAQMLLSLLNESEFSDAGKLTTLLRNAEASHQPAIRQLLQAAESMVSTAIDGKVMKDTMQTIFRSLGMNYESQLLGKEVQAERLMQTLKPQLLSMLSDPTVSASAKEVAEQFVVRMNGSPLMSTESGVNQQLVMQLPLEFFGKKIDATLQWSGRMNEDKKIDADFARILFYLNLHSLKETVIDMQVQNRVVTVTIFNENPSLKILGQPLQDKLKDGLKEIDYTLSGVFFKGFEKSKQALRPSERSEAIEGGLDFRI